MKILKLAVNAIQDAIKLLVVSGMSILKWFNSKFQDIYHIPGTFHCNVTNDSRNQVWSLLHLLEGSQEFFLLDSDLLWLVSLSCTKAQLKIKESVWSQATWSRVGQNVSSRSKCNKSDKKSW